MQQVTIIRDFFDKVLCRGEFGELENMVTDDVVCIAPQAVDIGRSAVCRTFKIHATAFHPLQVDVLFAAEIENRAAARICIRGRHSSTYAGVRASGRRVSLPCVYLFEFADGRICKIEVYYDVQLLTSQIGNGQVHALR